MATIPIDPNLRAPARELTALEKLEALGQQLKRQFQQEVGSLSQPRAATDILNRGMVAGLVGAPVDLLNLPIATLVPGRASEAPVGGSEWLGRQMERAGLVTPTRRPIAETAASIVSPLSAFKGAEMVGRAAKAASPTEIQKYVRSAQQAQGALPGTAAVKPKGGNWAGPSAFEEALEPFKRQVAPDQAQMDLVYARRGPEAAEQMARDVQQLPEVKQDLVVNKWVDTKLSRYIKNEMATPEDPVRRLAEEKGVSHVPDKEMFMESNAWLPDYVESARAQAGMPVEGYALQKFEAAGSPEELSANTRLAQAWENVTDSTISSEPASYYKNALGTHAPPWMSKADPNTPVYDIDARAVSEELGFDHLVDELRNAVNPDSDLPARLRWTPEQLEKVTVPQAVERVDEINKWRAEQTNKAIAASARNPATFTMKEYPEAGVKWVQLKMPEPNMEGLKSEYMPEVDMWRIINDKGDVLSSGATEREALGLLNREERIKSLENALGYEGQMLAHCVGGYCPEVVRGKSEIYSLRDAKDVPQVTIEVRPGRKLTERDLPDDVRDMLAEQYGDASREEFEAAVQTYLAKQEVPPEIVQIKGKANAAPKAEYVPMIQDFIRSREWSRVGDAQNANMYPIDRNVLGDIANFKPQAEDLDGLSRPMRMMLFEKAIDSGLLPEKGYVTREQWEGALRQVMSQGGGKAAGGRVKVEDPVRAEGIQRLAEGGSVKHPAAQGLPDPSMTNFSLYADTVSREMYPTKAENVQRDAARHILASALAAQKMGPGVAEFLGKAYEWKEAPVRTTGHWLGLSEPRPDYPTDIFNNSVGIEIGQKAKTMDELLNMVQQAVNQGTTKQEPGRALLVPDSIKTKYASGGEVKRGKIRVDDPVKLRRAQQLGLK